MVNTKMVIISTCNTQHLACDYILPICIVLLDAMLSFLVWYLAVSILAFVSSAGPTMSQDGQAIQQS